MRVRDNQNFFSLYYEPNIVETAVGETNPHADAVDWKRETKSLGQVATPNLLPDDGSLGYVGKADDRP